jgi:hypothetical protein
LRPQTVKRNAVDSNVVDACQTQQWPAHEIPDCIEAVKIGIHASAGPGALVSPPLDVGRRELEGKNAHQSVWVNECFS